MKKVLLLTEDDAAQLLIKALLADGYQITPGGVGVNFVTSSRGGIEVLVHNMEKAEEGEEDPVTEGTSKEQEEVEEIDWGHIMSAVEWFLVRRGGEGNAEEITPAVGERLADEGQLPYEVSRASWKLTLQALIPKVQSALETHAKFGKVVEEENELGDNYWTAVRPHMQDHRSTTASTAADILGSEEGGVLDRGDALEEGLLEGGAYEKAGGAPPRKKRVRRG